METLFAHGLVPDGHGALAFEILAAVFMVVPFLILAAVCWIFLRAKRREDALHTHR